MKSDGVTMETTEPIEAAAVAEPSSSQENIREQTPSQPEAAANETTPRKDPKANSSKSAAANPKVKPKAVASKTQPTGKSAGVSVPNPRPGTASHRTGSDLKSSNDVSAAAVKKAAMATKSSVGGAVPKRPAGATAVSATAKVQTRGPEKKPLGQTRTASAPASTVTNGTKPSSMTSAARKKPGTESEGRLKTTVATNRPAASAAPKPNPLTATKAGAAAVPKTSRPATGPSTSRPASTISKPTTATAKPNSAAAKPITARVTTAPPARTTTASQPPKTAAAAKKAPDGIRASPSAVAKKPATPKAVATRKPEPPKPTAPGKINSFPKWSTTAKTADPKVPQPKAHLTAKPAPIKKPVASIPASKAANSSQPQTKLGAKPTQAVSPFTLTKRAGISKSTRPAVEERGAAGAAGAAAAAAVAVAGGEIEHALSATPASSSDASAPEGPAPALDQDIRLEAVPRDTAQSLAAVSCPPQSPVGTASPQTPPPQEQLENSASLPTTQEQPAGEAEPSLPSVALPPDLSQEEVYLLTDHTHSTSKVPPAATNEIPQILSTNLNEEDDEEEREGSQLVSVSEMSGTTQPTEESRPGSGGPVGGSAWRAGAALLSELDSEEVSGSQQGASELSAPGVLEGTESMDDLGDGSLKGAIDMEGASAGSPDFEKVPDIPVNDFDEDEDEEDYDDRVCDMDVGSERADDPRRLRHDNDVDEDEDEDVEMASEGVTESGLESYGNPDEDDFVEDERLDNLNRVAQPPPPPPLLPSAPAAQWDQPNPFPGAWAEPLQPQPVLEPVSQPVRVEGAAAASPSKNPWQEDSETPTQTQAWLELGSGRLGCENKDSSDGDEPLNIQESSLVPVQTLAPAPLSAPGMSLSSTLSSETSTPEELGDCCQDPRFQPPAAAPSPQTDLDYQDPGFHPMRGNVKGEQVMEAENQPADEVWGCPANASTSNLSSPSSATEDDASDTEGEAQLDDSLESLVVGHLTFDCQPAAQRCLSVVEEGEEADMRESGAVEDTTPPSAISLASYGFDTMTTASNSNAQSTGESCLKSPGIFSPEELSEETKELCVVPQPHVQPRLAEEQYVDFGKAVEQSAAHVGEDVPGTEEAADSPSTVRAFQQPEETPDDGQPPYYSAICEKTGNSFAGFSALPHPHRRDQAAHPRAYCDIIKAHGGTANPPRLTCADLPPRNPAQQGLSPQLRRLEQHQRQLLELQELQQRREQQGRPLEEAEQERKRREEEEQRKKKEEAEEEIKRNKEEEKLQRKVKVQAEATKKEEKLRKEEEREKRKDLELQLQQQQQELMKWQPEQQQSKGQTVLLSPSTGLSTIYEALENSDEEEVPDEEEGMQELKPTKVKERRREPSNETIGRCENISDEDQHPDSSPSSEAPPPVPDPLLTHSDPSSPVSPASSPPLDLDWGKKVDIVQQLINQTLMLNRDGCSSLLLLPGGAGGTLSPLESSLWPSLLPPHTPPSATITSVSSFSPEATGSSPQGEWTVVELETHH